jgi:predicted dehydrogenase
MSSKIKIGLIGCGRAAEIIYLPALKKLKDIEVNAVIDPDKKRRELIGNNFPSCGKHDALNENLINSLDAAIILTPPETHIYFASEILKKNKYVLVEKPLSDSLEGIPGLADIESSSEGSLMMGFNHRYWEPVISLKEKLSKNLKINFAEIIFSSSISKWSPVSTKGNLLDDLGPHVFDLARFILNKEIISVVANSFHPAKIEMTLKLPDEIMVHCSIAHSEKTLKNINITADEKKISISNSSVRLEPAPGKVRDIYDLTDKISRKISGKTSPIKNTYDIQLNNFFNFVRLNKKAVPGIEDGIKAVIAAEAVRASLNQNKMEVFLDEFK